MGFTRVEIPGSGTRKRFRINKSIRRMNLTDEITTAGGSDPYTRLVIELDGSERMIRIKMVPNGTQGSFSVITSRYVVLPAEVIESFGVDMPLYEVDLEQREDGWWYGDLSTAHTFRRGNTRAE